MDNRPIIVVGDIHGDFGPFGFKLHNQYGIKDSIICVAGDIGVGFNKPNFHIKQIKKLNAIAKKGNNLILMTRGNHDDVSYFNGAYNESNVKLVPDYYVHNNILFIGGAVSIDRTHRTLGKTYWPDEVPYYDEEALSKIDNIDVIVTHSAPSFCEPVTKVGILDWLRIDPALTEDCSAERMTFTKVFDYLKLNNKLPKHWCYGHYHRSSRQIVDGVTFKCCDIMEFHEIRF